MSQQIFQNNYIATERLSQDVQQGVQQGMAPQPVPQSFIGAAIQRNCPSLYAFNQNIFFKTGLNIFSVAPFSLTAYFSIRLAVAAATACSRYTVLDNNKLTRTLCLAVAIAVGCMLSDND